MDVHVDGTRSLGAGVEDLVAEGFEARRREVRREELHGLRGDGGDRRGEVDDGGAVVGGVARGRLGSRAVRKEDALEIEEVDRRLHRRLNAEKLARAREDERLGGRPFDDL